MSIIIYSIYIVFCSVFSKTPTRGASVIIRTMSLEIGSISVAKNSVVRRAMENGCMISNWLSNSWKATICYGVRWSSVGRTQECNIWLSVILGWLLQIQFKGYVFVLIFFFPGMDNRIIVFQTSAVVFLQIRQIPCMSNLLNTVPVRSRKKSLLELNSIDFNTLLYFSVTLFIISTVWPVKFRDII